MRIKSVIILSVALLFAAPVLAQHKRDTVAYAEKIKQARGLRNLGATLTILGGVIMGAGIITAQNSSLDSGAGLAGAGLLTTAIGIPIWIVGGVNHRRYTKRSQIIARFKIDPSQRGIVLTYRF